MFRLVVLDSHSDFSAQMAAALAWSVSRVSPGLPVHIRVRDCLPRMSWPEQATVQFLRSRHTGKDGLQWLNKLEALAESPAEETLFLDCDMVALRDVRWWFGAEGLGTDDFTFWNFRRLREHAQPGQMEVNLLNSHAFCAHYGVDAVPAILGGGHFFYRRTPRGEAALQRVADIIIEAAENPRATDISVLT